MSEPFPWLFLFQSEEQTRMGNQNLLQWGTESHYLAPGFLLHSFVGTWKGRDFPMTFNMGLPDTPLLQGPLHGYGGDKMLQNPAWPDKRISGNCMKIWRKGRKRKKEKLIPPRQTWSHHNICAPAATRPTAVVLKLGHKII